MRGGFRKFNVVQSKLGLPDEISIVMFGLDREKQHNSSALMLESNKMATSEVLVEILPCCSSLLSRSGQVEGGNGVVHVLTWHGR